MFLFDEGPSLETLVLFHAAQLRLGASRGKSGAARKFRVPPGTAMGCSIPENVLFYLYSRNFNDAKC